MNKSECYKNCIKEYQDERCEKVDDYCIKKKIGKTTTYECKHDDKLKIKCNKSFGKNFCKQMCNCVDCNNNRIGFTECYDVFRQLSNNICNYVFEFKCDKNYIDTNYMTEFNRVVGIILGDAYKLKKYPKSNKYIKIQNTYVSSNLIINVIHDKKLIGAINAFQKEDVISKELYNILTENNLELQDVLLVVNSNSVFDNYKK